MDIYEVSLKGRKTVAEGTMAFYFERPEGFHFIAGQFADFTLLDPHETDDEGNIRTFSLASAPHDDELMIATRMRDSAFKRVLGSMPLGSTLELSGPRGDFMLHGDASRPAVFLAGGIGITPFRSMLRQAVHDRLAHRFNLFYSNRSPESTAFLKELREIEGANPNFNLVCTMAEMENSRLPWEGERGFITREMLDRYLEDPAAPVYYVAGPPGMVNAMWEMLTGGGIGHESIRAEEFPGY